MHLRRALVLVSLVAMTGCDDDDPTPAPEEKGPFLSQEPLWTLEKDTQNGASCFGTSIGLGDFNGDGRKDLVAALPGCGTLAARSMGRVGIHAGAESFFSQEAVSAEVRWQNTSPNTSGRGLTVAVGNVDGDGFADLLVRGLYGAQLFTGKADLGAMLAEPAFRVPGNGIFSNAFLSDVNGDGRDDIVNLRGGMASIYLSTPQAAEGPFTLARSLPAFTAIAVRDTNGDGAADLVIEYEGESSLYLGCKQGSALTCEGPLSAEPVWKSSRSIQATFPDQNGDGHVEYFIGDAMDGRMWLHFSEGATGAPSAVATWAVGGDPVFPGFGRHVIPMGDLDGNGQGSEFLITALGRMYLYTPEQGISADLRPTWAWPASDGFQEKQQGLRSFIPLRAGDLDGDGLEDLVVGMPPLPQSTEPGRVVVFNGGKVPRDTTAPFLPEKRNCVTATSGKPDITVDGDVLGRSLYLERKHFSETSCEMLEGCVSGTGERRLLRFSVSIPNFGSGQVRIPGVSRDPSLYQYDSCHAHDHLIGFASYELRDSLGIVTATGRKQGFYLIDFHPYCMDAAAPAEILDDDLVISPGWSDIYTSDLPCQWLDVTDVADGTYSLRVSVDNQNIIDEEDKLPNHADVKLTIQGDRVTLER
ncbi:lysyl oxidase family protein [Hyalangium gracile]|uniref:lysyl oxidase family protein n=1 Tax=Hyalangium gracile TaxID=394092 RepID=UPI001CCBDBB3|nr:lysyl oxidase family protein [Hyalangium gracile]